MRNREGGGKSETRRNSEGSGSRKAGWRQTETAVESFFFLLLLCFCLRNFFFFLFFLLPQKRCTILPASAIYLHSNLYTWHLLIVQIQPCGPLNLHHIQRVYSLFYYLMKALRFNHEPPLSIPLSFFYIPHSFCWPNFKWNWVFGCFNYIFINFPKKKNIGHANLYNICNQRDLKGE